MSKFLNIPDGDYKISVQEGGTITLNTGSETGTVEITGDLVVQGETTTVNTTNLDIEDNVIVLNKGETGPGITDLDGYAGIEIDRGGVNAQFVYDEALTDPVNPGLDGLFRFRLGSTTKGIYVNSISTGGDPLVLLGSTSAAGYLTVTGTSNYEQRVFSYDLSGNITGNIVDDDIIPNTKSVVDYIDFQFANVFLPQIGAGSTSITSITITDEEDTGLPSEIAFDVDGINIANFYDNRFEFGDIRITGTQIETISSNEDLIISSPGTGSVRIDDTLHINSVPGIDEDPLLEASLTPLTPNDGAKIYVNNQSTGGSGLYFVNSENTRDEIISRNRSLVFSMIF